jgi:flavin reductase (DIM6/NTAB) family NADH-FMN oxidoreductase RutF
MIKSESMLSIDPSKNTAIENYKLMIGSVIPRPIAFVTSLASDGTLNAAPFSYFNIASSKPPMISIAVLRKETGQKDTARNIVGLKEFVVHIVDEGIIAQVNETAASLPPDQSEMELTNFSEVESTKISVPGIKEAKIRMECILEHHVILGDEDAPSSDLIIGRVVQFHFNKEIYENGKINQTGLAAVSRLAGHNYAKIGEVFEIIRPK